MQKRINNSSKIDKIKADKNRPLMMIRLHGSHAYLHLRPTEVRKLLFEQFGRDYRTVEYTNSSEGFTHYVATPTGGIVAYMEGDI